MFAAEVAEDAEPGDHAELEPSSSTESTPMEEAPVSPHVLAVHSYKSPHFCDYCGEMLFGIVRQGLKCDGESREEGERMRCSMQSLQQRI